jgi:hypothetical protein
MFSFLYEVVFGLKLSKKNTLIEACFYNDEKKIKELLKLGENPNYIDDTGRTPLYWAAYSGDKSPVEILLNSGANPDFGESPILPSGEFNILELVAAKSHLDYYEKKKVKLIYPEICLKWSIGSKGNLKNMPQFIKKRAITAILCLRKVSDLPNEIIYYIIESCSF